MTHAHPDHLGMAARVREASGAMVGMHPAEAESVRRFHRATTRERMAAWLRARGAPAGDAQEILQVLGDAGARSA